MLRCLVLFLFLIAAGPAPAAAAGFPGYINYQGKLGNPAGNPLTGTYSFRFKFYDQATGGTLLATDANYTGVTNAVTVTNGLYSVQIGSLTAGGLPESVFHGGETWLQIEVSPGTDFTSVETLLPRERLASVPFAFRAVNAEKLGIGVAIATFTTAGNLQLVSGSTLTTNGTLTISTAATSALTGTPAIFIDNSGKIGLGTTGPAERLDLGGGQISMGYEIVTQAGTTPTSGWTYATATCPTGKQALGGACDQGGAICQTFTSDITATTYVCGFYTCNVAVGFNTKVTCANIK